MNQEQLKALGLNEETAQEILKLSETKQSARNLLTRGEKSVGMTFNPSGDPAVNKVKQHCADMIDLLHEVHESRNNPSWENNVFRTEAFNKIIAAQMAVVKYLTYRD